MRQYDENNKLLTADCNGCGKKLKVQKGIIEEGVFSASYAFGYFSTKDEEIHKFDLCEECYDKWIKSFQIPVEIGHKTELL